MINDSEITKMFEISQQAMRDEEAAEAERKREAKLDADIEAVRIALEREKEFFLIPKNSKYPDGAKKVDVSLLTIYIKKKYKLKCYNGQFRVLKNNYYYHIENMKWLISDEIPEEHRIPKNIEDCEKLLFYDKSLILKDDDLAPEKYIAFKNGVLDTETMIFVNYKDKTVKDLIFIHQVDYNWNPSAAADPMTDEFFKSVTNGKQEDIDYLYQVLGVAMSNYRDFKNIFYFTGKKDSGKSQYLHLIENFLTSSDGVRDYSSIGLSMLTNENSKELVGIVGKRANICGETPDLKITSDTFLKQLSGGDWATVYVKFLGSMEFVNKAILIFSGNTVPNFFVSDKSSISERLLIYTFKNSIPTEEQIPSIYKKLDMEYVIKKAVGQLRVFIKDQQHFTVPKEIHENRELMERESDSIYRFFKDCVVFTNDDSHRINSFDLFTSFTYFLMEEGSISPAWDGKPDTKTLKLTQRVFISKIKAFIGESHHKKKIAYHDGTKQDCFVGIQIQNISITRYEHEKSEFKLVK